MNTTRHDLQSNLENIIRQHKIESQVTAIVLGLTLATGGNGLVVVALDENNTDQMTNAETIRLNNSVDRAPGLSSTPTDLAPSAQATSLIIPKVAPAPNSNTHAHTQPSRQPSPKPTVLQKPASLKPAQQSLSRPPVSALRKGPSQFKQSEVRPMSDTTKNNLDTMELSAARYESFLNSIDTSHLQFAQQYTPFNPNKVAIEQKRTEFFTLHFTAFYSNFGESSKTQPVGEMDVRKLIDSMGSRGEVCCGINWLLARNGQVYQTATVAAKLRHNPPFDSITTGVEVEASDQDSITPAQYEALTYLTIAVLKHQNLLDEELAKTVHGHGEDRDRYRQNNPGTKWEVRNDFDAAVSNYFRSKVSLFLDQNADIKNIAVPVN